GEGGPSYPEFGREVPELYQRYNDELEMIPEARAGEIVTVYEHCIDDSIYRFYDFAGDTFIDGLVRYKIVGIVRYPTTSPKVYDSSEDIKWLGRRSLKELASGDINDIYHYGRGRCYLEIFNRGEVEDQPKARV
ncbi:hypothetical protein L195_g030056, partial [Trifolium pratense]